MTQPIVGTGSTLNKDKLNIPSPPSTKSGQLNQNIRAMRGNQSISANVVPTAVSVNDANRKNVVLIQNNRLEISKDGIFV